MSTEPCSHVTVTQLTVRPADMDAERNVNNVVYFEYFHQSRLEDLARLGVWRPCGAQDDNLFALAENTCDTWPLQFTVMCCRSGPQRTPSAEAASSWSIEFGVRATVH